VLFAVLWLTATTSLIKPNSDPGQTGRKLVGLPRRKAASRPRKTAASTSG
jgi:hypothetical protein